MTLYEKRGLGLTTWSPLAYGAPSCLTTGLTTDLTIWSPLAYGSPICLTDQPRTDHLYARNVLHDMTTGLTAV